MKVDPQLDAALARVETHLAALGDALGGHGADALAGQAAELQRALAAALPLLRRGAREGRLSPPLRERLALAAGRVAAQREALARAGAALDRGLELLLPGAVSDSAYASAGTGRPAARGGSLQA